MTQMVIDVFVNVRVFFKLTVTVRSSGKRFSSILDPFLTFCAMVTPVRRAEKIQK